jgi:putative transposase
MVNSLKGVSSRRYGQAGYPKPYGKDALWSPSYFVSSLGGATLEVLKCYIKDQEKPSFYDGVLTQIFDKIEINISVVTRC